MNDKSNTSKKLILLPIVAVAIATLCAASACRKLPSLNLLSSLYPSANYTADYIEENKGEVLVEIPEVFELANIAIAISDDGLNDPWRVHKKGAYYERVLEHFKPFKDHPLIAEPDLNRNFTYNFRDNSICYVFETDKIVHGGLYSNMRHPDLFKKHLALAEDFARVSNFRKFYRDNLPHYQEQIQLYRQKVPLRRMWTWLEERFPARHDCYKVVFSPLIGASHETCSFENKGFSETIMFISGPGEPQDFAGAVGEGLLSRVVFTEIDHNYVNRVTKEYAQRVNKAFADLDAWNRQDGYRRPEYTFNEYMTWAVFVLYVYDNYEKNDLEVIVKRSAVDTMVRHRKFLRFEEFAQQLLKLYRQRESSQSIPDLYPAILDWAEEYERQQRRQLADAISAHEQALESEPNAVTVHLKLADLYRQQGNEAQARKHHKATGLLDDDAWMIIGPFDNTDTVGFDAQYPPETKMDFTSEYPGKGKTAKWFKPKSGQIDGYVNLLQLIQPFEWAVAYAAACVQSPDAREAQLRIGSDDDIKVWLNGKLALSKAVDRGAAVDQDIIPITLRTGPNQLLLKVCNRRQGWGFYARITDSTGQPYDDLRFLPRKPPTLPYNGLEEFIEFVRNVKKKIVIERSYKIETEQELVLAPGQAAHLDFRDNPAGVAEFIFLYDDEAVHIIYRCTDDTEKQYNSTWLHLEKLKGSRWITASGAATFLKIFYEWEPKDGKAFVKFRTELPSEKDIQEIKERELHMDAMWQQAMSVREWDYDQEIEPLKIIMDDPNDPNMVKLRTKYDLEELVRDAADDYEKLGLILAWVQERWKHHGSNRPSKSDPLTILKEAAEGKRFRCVEYAIVVAACARSLGMPSRRLALKRPDVETAKSGAGHVVAEVWLKQFKKWVFVDGQYGAVAERNGVPLNAVEFQDAIARKIAGLKISFASEGVKEDYIKWIVPYLYYLDFNLDQRFFAKDYEKRRYTPLRGKIMLVPKGAKKPKVFQRSTPIKNCTYISNPRVFYPHMNE